MTFLIFIMILTVVYFHYSFKIYDTLSSWIGPSVYLLDFLTRNNYCRIVLLQIVVFLKFLTARWAVDKKY